MRTYKLVMSVIILFSAVSAVGQQQSAAPPQRPAITKGYYSIGNNASKLSPPVQMAVKPVTLTGTERNKGYFSIGKNRRKLPGQAGFIPLSNKRSVTTKGYYSIGNNADKLRN